jgi:hypothetical protein
VRHLPGGVGWQREGSREGKAAGSGEFLLADDDVSGDGKSTNRFHVTSHIT